MSTQILVNRVMPTRHDTTNLRDCAVTFALDQRAFGPRRVLVAVADRRGRFRGLAHIERPDPPELALVPCLESLGRTIRRGAVAAVVYCDEPVTEGPPPPGLADRFAACRSVAAFYGAYLVDWFSCDDQLFRSNRLALEPDGDWWDLPG